MRNYQYLDVASVNDENILSVKNKVENDQQPWLTMSREGAFVSISASFGPLEIAHRLRHADLVRHLSNLYPVPGLATTRQIAGGANSYIGFGLGEDGKLIMRPTIVADAGGLLIINLVCTSEVRVIIFDWLEISA